MFKNLKYMVLMLPIALCQCQNEVKEMKNDWIVDRFDDVKVMRFDVPGFDSLSLDRKKLVYYLSQAALCGRDILFDQNFKYNLAIRKTLEAMYTSYDGDKNASEFKFFEEYLKKVWFANGIHHHYSGDKFTPKFSEKFFDELYGKVSIDSLPTEYGSKEELKTLIKPVIFDPSLYAKRVNQGQGEDMVAASANNYYEGMTQAEAEEFYARMVDPKDNQPISYGLNSKLVKEADGKLTERVWKVGGMYSPAIEKIVYWLEKAKDVAENDLQKRTIESLIKYYQSGDLKQFDDYNVLWVGDSISQVDFVNGFIEVYGDPLGYKASWESIVNFKNIEATKRTAAISAEAAWFEANSPIDDKYKKTEVKGVSAKVINVAMLGGDCFPASPIGINLPNADWIRRDYGSKSVTLENITNANVESAKGSGFTEEFVLKEEERKLYEKYGVLADNLHTDLHECLGHGSGQLAPGTKGDELRNYGSPLEEARADLFALYYLGDQKMVDIGLIESVEVAHAQYSRYIMNGMMTQLTRIEQGKNVEQAHMRCRKLISEWCYEHGKADNVIEVVKKDGKTYVVVNDYDKLRGLFAQLLREIQRIKSEGDFEAGKSLVETFGVNVDPELHKEVLERYAKLNLAPYGGFINPKYVIETSEDGEIKDVKFIPQYDYTAQMLEYSKEYSFLPAMN